MRSGTSRRVRVAVLAVAVVFASDVLIAILDPGFATLAPIDEAAHLATAVAILIAVGASPGPTVFACLVAVVLLDLDHLPAVFESGPELSDQRPATHSLAMPAVVGCAGLLLHGRARQFALGAAAGLALHLLRDLATGPGVPLLAPATPEAFSVPYALYALVLVGALLASVSGSRWR